MQLKYGELLPKVEQSRETKAIGYYVADNATLTIYNSPETRLGLYTFLSFLLGGALGVLLFGWNNSAYSSDRALALLRSEPEREFQMIGGEFIHGKTEVEARIVATSKQEVLPAKEQRPTKFRSVEADIKDANTFSIESNKKITKSVARSVRRAIMLAKGQDFKVAEGLLLGEYQRGHSSKDLLNALGALYSKQRKWKKAALSYTRACSNYSPDAVCFYNLAVSYDHLKERERAVAAYQKALNYFSSDGLEVEAISAQRRIVELTQW